MRLLRGLLRFVFPPRPDRREELRAFFDADPESLAEAIRRCREALDRKQRSRP